MSSAPLSVHWHPIRVYYEDTDVAGVVYYANYLKFTERARSEMLRAAGVDQAALKTEQGIAFVVRRVEADYRAPALYDDVLQVRTSVREIGGARLRLAQDVFRAETPGAVEPGGLLVATEVEIAAMGTAGRPLRLPQELRAALSGAVSA